MKSERFVGFVFIPKLGLLDLKECSKIILHRVTFSIFALHPEEYLILLW